MMASRSAGVSTACSSLPRSASIGCGWCRPIVPRAPDAFLDQIVESIERRWAVARVRQRAGMVARLLRQRTASDNERLEQPHQRAPVLHGAAKLMHRVLARQFRIGNGPAGLARIWAAMARTVGPIAALGCKAGLSPIPLLEGVHDV